MGISIAGADIGGYRVTAIGRAAPTDRELVTRAGEGDGEAFGLLYDRHVEVVYRYVRFRVRDTALAEDLTHDVFVAALQALPRLQWQGDVRPWLLHIAHNRVANHWRSVARRPVPADLAALDDRAERAGPPDADDPTTRLLDKTDAAAIWNGVTDLSDAEQEVVALRFGLDWSVAEVARHLGRTESAVRNLQYRAVRRLAVVWRGRDDR